MSLSTKKWYNFLVFITKLKLEVMFGDQVQSQTDILENFGNFSFDQKRASSGNCSF